MLYLGLALGAVLGSCISIILLVLIKDLTKRSKNEYGSYYPDDSESEGASFASMFPSSTSVND